MAAAFRGSIRKTIYGAAPKQQGEVPYGPAPIFINYSSNNNTRAGEASMPDNFKGAATIR